MRNIGFFKKLRLFYTYCKAVKANRQLLEDNLNLRLDNANRLYTVINIPEDLFGEGYMYRKNEIDKISESYIREFTNAASKELIKIGLNELHSIYKIERVDKLSYLIVIGFSLFKSNEFFNTLYYRIIPFVTLASIISYFIFK